MSDYMFVNGDLVNCDELMHYGVPGMKWGKRKALKKLMKLEAKAAKYQDQADYQRNMSKEIIKRKTQGASLMKNDIKVKGKLGEANGILNAAKSKYANQASLALTRSAIKTANSRGKKAAKAQAKADKWNRKISKLKKKKKIDTGRSSAAAYMLKMTTGG